VEGNWGEGKYPVTVGHFERHDHGKREIGGRLELVNIDYKLSIIFGTCGKPEKSLGVPMGTQLSVG
jgi:hypothetical protein